MRKIEIIRGIIGILLFVVGAVVITNNALKAHKQRQSIVVQICSCYAQGVGQLDEEVTPEDKAKVKEEKIIVFNNNEYEAKRSDKKINKTVHLPYAVAEYKTESGESFSVNVDTGEVVEYIYGNVDKKGADISDTDREKIAEGYANEIRNVEEYKMNYEEMSGFYIYDYVKYVKNFKTTDEIKVILLGDGTLYMFCSYTLGEFDELDEMYEVDEENYYERGPYLEKSQVLAATTAEVKKQFGDTVFFEEKEIVIVKKRDGEFAVLVIVDVFDENGEAVAIRERYYVTWE